MTTNEIHRGSDAPASTVWQLNADSPRATDAWCPVKTPEGQAEIRQRHRKLTQRQRTMLLLVDGHRSAAQVKTLGLQAGATDTAFDELLDLGLIAAPPPATPVKESSDAGPAVASEADLANEADVGAFEQFELESDRLAEQTAPNTSNRVDTVVGSLLPFLKSTTGKHDAHDVAINSDNALEEARRTLDREVPPRRH